MQRPDANHKLMQRILCKSAGLEIYLSSGGWGSLTYREKSALWVDGKEVEGVHQLAATTNYAPGVCARPCLKEAFQNRGVVNYH